MAMLMIQRESGGTWERIEVMEWREVAVEDMVPSTVILCSQDGTRYRVERDEFLAMVKSIASGRVGMLGGKISAIKLLRGLVPGIGLKEAKDVVDSLVG